MNFLLDNNLPPPLARALNVLCEKDGHHVFALRDKFPQNEQDLRWIQHLSQEGNWSVISLDRFRKGELEKQAFRECGLPIFCLAKHWANENYWDKAWNLVRWWPHIMQQASLISGGAAFRVPWRIAAQARSEQIRI